MKSVIINPAAESMDNDFRGNNDFLLEMLKTLLTSNCQADQITPLKKELQDLQNMLTLFEPLGRYICGIHWHINQEQILKTLLTLHRKAAFLIYLCFVGKMDIEMVLWVKTKISILIEETNVQEIYTLILNESLSKGDYEEEALYVLENLMILLETNDESLDDANSKLQKVLMDIHTFALALPPNVLLRKLHLLQSLSEDILIHSIPIIYSCYLQHGEVDISAELNCVLDLIKHIKYESQEIKLYYFPRADDLGFLEFFSGYLEDLMEKQEISIKEEIAALHYEVHSLLLLAKVTNEEDLKKTPLWNNIINMAYQAEYIIDLYLANSSRHCGLISSLSKIIEQLKNIRPHANGSTRLSAQDVAVTSELQVLGMATQANDKTAIVDFQEEARIAEYLLQGEDRLDVISIVGMAGVGKTTLALHLYKTSSIAHHFDILAWCTVSQSWQYSDLLHSILDQVNPFDQGSTRDDEESSVRLCRSLKKRRYLIVLDDIWDTKFCNDLKRYLPDGKGNRILVTTRNMDVAVQIGSKVNELHGLSDEKSWELFLKKMLETESLSHSLLKISKGIVENCKGLPLSIVIIAGILSGLERTEKRWNQIAERVSSFVLSDSQGKCKAILELSYNSLPNRLRSCFLYLGSFPEDIELSVNHVISLWIGEELVPDSKSDDVEEVAKKYVEDLIARSLVIPAKERSRGGVKTFRLHDLLRDFCLHKAKEKHFFMVLDDRSNSRLLQDPRRLVINRTMSGPINPKALDFSCHSIRSMICYDQLEASGIEKGIESCDMVLLKVLKVDGIQYNCFPNVSSLIHLRYLSLLLWHVGMPVLPSSISKLQNLQILKLCSAYSRITVPDFIWDLMKLRYVAINPEASFQVDNKRLQNSSILLENLTSLSKARVSCGDSKWLSKLPKLQRLSCVFADDDTEVDDVIEDNQFRVLSFNVHLNSLKVERAGWKQRFISSCQLPNSLRKLTLSGLFLTSNDISKIGRAVPQLEVFKIYSCLVPFGYEWNVDDEDFPELKVLILRKLFISKWIASEYSFPNLEKLWVESCEYLDEIPPGFGYLLKLRLITVRECPPAVEESARNIEKQQHEDQNIEMRVSIYPKIIINTSRRAVQFAGVQNNVVHEHIDAENPETRVHQQQKCNHSSESIGKTSRKKTI